MSNNIIIDKYLKYLNEFNKSIFNIDRYKEYDDFIDNEFIPLQLKIKESRINIEQENITKPTLYESNKLEPTLYESNKLEPISYESNKLELTPYEINKLKYTPYESNKLEPISKPNVFDKISTDSRIHGGIYSFYHLKQIIVKLNEKSKYNTLLNNDELSFISTHINGYINDYNKKFHIDIEKNAIDLMSYYLKILKYYNYNNLIFAVGIIILFVIIQKLDKVNNNNFTLANSKDCFNINIIPMNEKSTEPEGSCLYMSLILYLIDSDKNIVLNLINNSRKNILDLIQTNQYEFIKTLSNKISNINDPFDFRNVESVRCISWAVEIILKWKSNFYYDALDYLHYNKFTNEIIIDSLPKNMNIIGDENTELFISTKVNNNNSNNIITNFKIYNINIKQDKYNRNEYIKTIQTYNPFTKDVEINEYTYVNDRKKRWKKLTNIKVNKIQVFYKNLPLTFIFDLYNNHSYISCHAVTVKCIDSKTNEYIEIDSNEDNNKLQNKNYRENTIVNFKLDNNSFVFDNKLISINTTWYEKNTILSFEKINTVFYFRRLTSHYIANKTYEFMIRTKFTTKTTEYNWDNKNDNTELWIQNSIVDIENSTLLLTIDKKYSNIKDVVGNNYTLDQYYDMMHKLVNAETYIKNGKKYGFLIVKFITPNKEYILLYLGGELWYDLNTNQHGFYYIQDPINTNDDITIKNSNLTNINDSYCLFEFGQNMTQYFNNLRQLINSKFNINQQPKLNLNINAQTFQRTGQKYKKGGYTSENINNYNIDKILQIIFEVCILIIIIVVIVKIIKSTIKKMINYT